MKSFNVFNEAKFVSTEFRVRRPLGMQNSIFSFLFYMQNFI